MSSIRAVSIWSQLALHLKSSLLSVSISCCQIKVGGWLRTRTLIKFRNKSYTQFVDDGACSPSVFQSDICQVGVRMIAEVKNLMSAPAREILQNLHRALVVDDTFLQFRYAVPRVGVGLLVVNPKSIVSGPLDAINEERRPRVSYNLCK